MDKILYRAEETAKAFSISKQTLWRWTQEEKFPQPLKRGRVTLYDIEAIKEWLKGEVK